MTDKVDREAIERVARLIIPDRVLLVNSIVDLADIPPAPDESIMVQYSKPICDSFEAQALDENLYGYVFNVVTGIRFLDADRCNDDDSNPDECVIGLISAEFRVFYHSKSDETCEDADLKEFSKQNVAFHVWPYWRVV